MAFSSTAFISSPAYNQWQLYFKGNDTGIIAGYIHIFISLFGMVGAWVSGKLKIKNHLKFFIKLDIVIFLALVCSVFISYFYVSLLFFFIHILLLTVQEVFKFTYLNTLLNEKTRTSLLSVYYAIDAVFNVVVISASGWAYEAAGLGNSWIILGLIGLILSIMLMMKASDMRELKNV